MPKGLIEIEAYWKGGISGLLAALAAVLISCRPDQSNDVAFQQVLPLCNEFFLPNSMARPSGFDLSAHLEQLSRQIRDHAAGFNTPAGVRYLRVRLEREPDDIARACIRRLLDELREGAA